MPAITPMGAQLIFNHMTGASEWPFGGGAWLAMFTDIPYDEATGVIGAEFSGGGYERQQVLPAALEAGDLMLTNISSLRFSDLPGGEVGGVGIFTDPLAGTLMFYEAYDPPPILNVGQRFVVLTETLSVMFT